MDQSQWEGKINRFIIVKINTIKLHIAIHLMCVILLVFVNTYACGVYCVALGRGSVNIA